MSTIQSAIISQHPACHLGMDTDYPERLLTFALKAFRVSRQRKRLTEMSTQQLADIGLSRTQAETEAARPFWDLPSRQPDPH